MTHSQESQAGLLLPREDVLMLVPEFPMQLLQNFLQSLVHGEHCLPQTDFVAAKHSPVSRAASTTAARPGPVLQDLGCPGTQLGQVDTADGVFLMGLPAVCWLWAGPAGFGCCGPVLGSVVGWRAPLPSGGASVFLMSGSQRVSGSLSPQGTSPPRSQDKYLNIGATFRAVATTR